MKAYRRFLLFFLLIPFQVSSDQIDAKKAGEEFGKPGRKFTLQSMKMFSAQDLLPTHAVPFDAASAAESLLQEKSPDSEVLQYLLSDEVQRNPRENSHLSQNESLFERADEMIHGRAQPLEADLWQPTFTYETCQEAAAPYATSLIRTLDVDVTIEPPKTRETKVCSSHERSEGFYWKRHAERWVERQKADLAADPLIEYYEARITGGGTFSTYTTLAKWTHKNNTDTCNAFRMDKEVLPEKAVEGEERWSFDHESLVPHALGPDCTLLEQICLDSSPKEIQGQQVQRQCWKEKLNFLCRYPETGQCALLRGKNCQETARRCLQEGQKGCALWEITYKCLQAMHRNTPKVGSEIFGLGKEPWQVDYEPNQGLMEVCAKLAVIEEMKKDLEKADFSDVNSVQIFKGKAMSCSKNIADKIMYDCCFAFGGLANDLKLSQCSEEELSLGEMRQKGLCHYVGKQEQKFLDLWKSRDEHVFCCFNSKLARVFQEEARNQLQQDWGTASHPECQGFFIDEFTQVNLARLDLSQSFDEPPAGIKERLQQKLEALQPRLQERLQREYGT